MVLDLRDLRVCLGGKVRQAWGSGYAGAVPEFELPESAVGWDSAEEEGQAAEGCTIRHSFSCADRRNIGI